LPQPKKIAKIKLGHSGGVGAMEEVNGWVPWSFKLTSSVV